MRIIRDVVVALFQLQKPFERNAFALSSAAPRAHLVDDAVIPAHRVSVYGVVDRAIADAHFFHAAHDAFKCVDVFARIAVELHVADMPRIRERVKRRFSANLFIGADGVIHRHVKRVCVILSVRNAGNFAVFLLVYAHKAAGKPLCGRCEQGEVEAGLTAFFVHFLPHMGDDLKPQLPAFFAFAVVLTGEGF